MQPPPEHIRRLALACAEDGRVFRGDSRTLVIADAEIARDVLEAPGFLLKAPAVLRDPRPSSARRDFHEIVRSIAPACRDRAAGLDVRALAVGRWPAHGVSAFRHQVMQPAIEEVLADDVRDRVRRLVAVRDRVSRVPGATALMDVLGQGRATTSSDMELVRAVIGTGRPLGHALASAVYLMLHHRDRARAATVEHLVRESLRLAPPAWLVVREIAEADAAPESLGGDALRGVRSIAVCVYLAQRDPAVWSEPDVWDPSRWDGRTRNTLGFLPFGAGEERCFGRGLSYDLLVQVVGALRERLDQLTITRESALRPGPLFGLADFDTALRR